jgi:16S rRNA (cytidine1402-2'-O)-methyltransferase
MLYIVGTPIGNLDDITLRQAKILSIADIILSEDTRSAGTLLQGIRERFSIDFPNETHIRSYYKDNEFHKLASVIDDLLEGKRICLISEAGMPLVSDPGLLLVKTCIRQGIEFAVVPGITAATTALIYSGFNQDHHMFMGFLPKKSTAVQTIINQMKELKKIDKELVFVCYESPHRLHETLQLFNELIPDAQICICRELTKKFEEISRGKPAELLNRDYKGEITLVISL